VLGPQDDSALLAGQVDAGGPPEAEAPYPLVEVPRAQLQPDHHRADVRRLREDLRHRLRAATSVVGLADRPVGHLDLRRHRQGGAGLHEALGERARDRDRLEGRAGLVVRLDRAILSREGGRPVHVVGIHARPVREREDLAGARIHHDRGGALRRVGLPHLAQDGLGALLDARVEGELEAPPRRGSLRLDQAHRFAERVLDEPALAVLAAKILVARVLEPREPNVVGPNEPEHLRRQVALRVDALGLRHGADALDPELLDLLPEGGIHLAAQIDEGQLPVRELPQQLVLAAADQRGEPGRHLRRVVDQERVGEHGHGIL
jgi:hypothetical protein